MKAPCILLLLAALGASGFARDLSSSDATALQKRFFAARQKTRTLEAAFTQTISAPGLENPAISRGQLFYRAPDELRISYQVPPGELMQLDAGNFTTIRTGRAPVVRSASHPSARTLGALRDILRWNQPPGDMQVSVTRQAGHYRVVLVPSARGGFQPEKIENTIDEDTMELRSMTLTLPRGTVMRFDFSATRRNHRLSTDAFRLP